VGPPGGFGNYVTTEDVPLSVGLVMSAGDEPGTPVAGGSVERPELRSQPPWVATGELRNAVDAVPLLQQVDSLLSGPSRQQVPGLPHGNRAERGAVGRTSGTETSHVHNLAPKPPGRATPDPHRGAGTRRVTAMTEPTTTNAPRLRRALDQVPAYSPGRPAATRPGVVTYKASSNENPYPPLPGVLDAVAAEAASMNRYPDMFAAELVHELAHRFDVPVEHIATGTGSVGVLQQIVQSTCAEGDEVVYAWRSFEAYPIVVQIAGATPVPVPLTADEAHDLDGMADAVTDRTRLVLVCTPNNPTGPAVHRDALERFLDRVPRDILVVIDEAYREFVRDPTVADGLELYRTRPNVAVLRTFSKAYGLAGLRVGFAVAHPAVAAALRKTAVPFGVSTLAQRAAVESLRAEKALLARVETLVAERERVLTELRRQGWVVPETEANFVWLRLGERTADFAAACEASGVVVRPYATDGVRVTIAEPEANDLFLGVAARWLDPGSPDPSTDPAAEAVPPGQAMAEELPPPG
jgi:histidinol-phosphate aminotransferase